MGRTPCTRQYTRDLKANFAPLHAETTRAVLWGTRRLAMPSLCIILGAGSAFAKAHPRPAQPPAAAIERILGVLGLEPATGETEEAQAAAKAAADRLSAKATADQPALLVQRAREDQAKATLEGARRTWQPTASLMGQLSRDWLHEDSRHTSSRADDAQAAAQLKANLYRGGQDLRKIKEAELDLASASHNTEDNEATLIYGVQRAALSFNQAAMRLKLAQASLDDAAEISRVTERKVEVGLSGRLDLDTARMRESTATTQVATAQQTLLSAKYALWEALGDKLETAQPPTTELTQLAAAGLPLPSPMPEFKENAPASFREQSAAESLAKSQLQIDDAYAARWQPNIDVTSTFTRDTQVATAGYMPGTLPMTPMANSFATLFGGGTQRTRTVALGLELNWTLWSPSLTTQLEQSLMERQIAQATLAQARAETAFRAERLKSELALAIGSLPRFREAFYQASRVYQGQWELYKVGEADLFVLLDADTQRLTAVSNWYDASARLQLLLLEWQALQKGVVVAQGASAP